MIGPVLFRADASASVGMGHVVRTLALAQALRDQGNLAAFHSSYLPAGLRSRIAAEAVVYDLQTVAYGISDARETSRLAHQFGASWVVLDGYEFEPPYEKIVIDSGLKILRLDDHGHLPHYHANIVLNQNDCAEGIQYKNIDAGSKLLLGTRYVILGRNFRTGTPQKRVRSVAKRVLVTMGGSDPCNLTPMIIRALTGSNLDVVIAVGESNPYREHVHTAAREMGSHAEVVVGATNMHDLMMKCDIAITAGGSTCYELAYMGVPMLAIIVAENQLGVVTDLARRGVAIDLGWWTDVIGKNIFEALQRLAFDQERRASVQAAGTRLIDGQGVFRVLMHMAGASLRLRDANSADCEMIFHWANDPVTRSSSFSSAPIPWDTHVVWFRARLDDISHRFYIGVNEAEEPVGQVRFACSQAHSVISVSVAPEMRGSKYGYELVMQGCERLFCETHVQLIEAHVKSDNSASIAIFGKAGFTNSGLEGAGSVLLILKR